MVEGLLRRGFRSPHFSDLIRVPLLSSHHQWRPPFLPLLPPPPPPPPTPRSITWTFHVRFPSKSSIAKLWVSQLFYSFNRFHFRLVLPLSHILISFFFDSVFEARSFWGHAFWFHQDAQSEVLPQSQVPLCFLSIFLFYEIQLFKVLLFINLLLSDQRVDGTYWGSFSVHGDN